MNVPVEALETTSRTFTFGQVESGDEAIVPSFEGERTGKGDGNRDGDGDGTTSGGSIDSIRINAMLLAAESQHTRQTRRMRDGNSPMSPVPPIYHAECPYGIVTRQCRHGRLKVEAKNVSQMWKVEKIYLQHTGIMQPRGNHPKRAYRVIGPCHQRGRIKIESTKVSQSRKDETAYLGHTGIVQPHQNVSKRCCGVVGPWC